MSLGPLEIVVILVIALLVFGPKRLPEVGKQVGSALREIRKVQDSVRSEVNAVIQAAPGPASPASKPTSSPASGEENDHDEGAAAHPEPPSAGPPDVDPGFDGPPGSFS